VSVSDLWAVFETDALGRIIALSLTVSLSATALATLFGAPLGAALAVYAIPGRQILVIIVNALLGLPPVVVGLALYVLLSRSGPLGAFHLLFTPGAMMLAQALLALPIVTALVHSAAAHTWAEYGAALQVDGATRLQSIPHLLAITRSQLITAVLAGFGRTISEVGAILIVGGNIAGYTRTMTTSIVLETSKGDLSLGLGLGFVLIGISIAVSTATFALGTREAGVGKINSSRGNPNRLRHIGRRIEPGRPTITLASTTSVENSGLLAHILPRFTSETGIAVRVLGTGQALATAAHGDADLVLVHDPEAE
jgi:tungstate transport system permease protein